MPCIESPVALTGDFGPFAGSTNLTQQPSPNHFFNHPTTTPTITQPRLNHPSCRIQERFRHNHPSSVDSPTQPQPNDAKWERRTYHRRAAKAYFRAGPFTRASISRCPADGCWSRCRRSAVASGLASDAPSPPLRSARCRVRDVPTDTSARRQSAHPRR